MFLQLSFSFKMWHVAESPPPGASQQLLPFKRLSHWATELDSPKSKKSMAWHEPCSQRVMLFWHKIQSKGIGACCWGPFSRGPLLLLLVCACIAVAGIAPAGHWTVSGAGDRKLAVKPCRDQNVFVIWPARSVMLSRSPKMHYACRRCKGAAFFELPRAEAHYQVQEQQTERHCNF